MGWNNASSIGLSLLAITVLCQCNETSKSAVIYVEAEDFVEQTLDSVRKWVLHSKNEVADEPMPQPDPDPPHLEGVSGTGYLEALPDTRATHGDPLIKGENFSNEPGQLAVLSYEVDFPEAGRYFVWVRAFSTGTEDNGIHVGLNGDWPESGQRWQTTVKKKWHWECRQRTEQVHVGIPMQLYLDIPSAGVHTVSLSMREDGFEIDRFCLAMDEAFRPSE